MAVVNIRQVSKLVNPFLGVVTSQRMYSSQASLGSTENMQTPSSLFNDDHEQMRRSLRKVIDQDINPYVDEWEKAKQFPAHEVFKKLGNAGCLGVNRPVDCGGLGLDYSYNVALAEELGNINCGAIPMAIGVQTDMATPALAKHGNDVVKNEFLKPSISGDKVACLGVSEPSAGSDVAGIKTKAVRQGDDYIINGSKLWITNGWQADWICLLVNTEGGHPPYLNKTLICVPMDTQGIKLARRISKLGMYSSDTAEMYFEDVRVPASYRIGEEGKGFMYQMGQFQEERLFAGAAALVPMNKIIADTIEYTRGRKAFAGSILDNQVVHFRLAELESEVECLRSLVYRSVGLYIEGHDVTKYASMVKLKAGRLAREVTDACLQYWGGMGFTDEVLVSRFYRDFRLLSIGGGADEVMLGIICKQMGIAPEPQRKKK